jgi:copper(I)-binding protein
MIRSLLAAAALCAASPALSQDVAVEGAFARAVPEGVRASAAYMTLVNAGDADDRLIAAEAPFAARVELHTHLMEDGVAKMREVEGGIPVPAGESVTLEPGGLHVMLMGLSAPLAEGETAPLTLRVRIGRRDRGRRADPRREADGPWRLTPRERRRPSQGPASRACAASYRSPRTASARARHGASSQ